MRLLVGRDDEGPLLSNFLPSRAFNSESTSANLYEHAMNLDISELMYLLIMHRNFRIFGPNIGTEYLERIIIKEPPNILVEYSCRIF